MNVDREVPGAGVPSTSSATPARTSPQAKPALGTSALGTGGRGAAGPVVDVIVLDLDGGAMLGECLASIRAQTVPCNVVLFDNGSTTPTPNAIRSEVNLGFAGGVNAAYRHTAAPFVALVNNDVVLEREWLEQLLAAMQRDEKLAAVQTIIRRPDGRIDGAGIDISDGTFRQIGHGRQLGEPLAVAWGVSATATLYRRAALGEQVFDESLFAYYEDVELCARLRKDAWRIAVLPIVGATHRGSASANRLGKEALRLRTRNRYLVARKHGIGSVFALIQEDVKLALHGRTSLRGMMQGLFG